MRPNKLDAYRERIISALNDDPAGWRHSIWRELGVDPQPPISAEERWLVDEATRTGNWDLVKRKVWDRDTDGNWVKLWTLAEPNTTKPAEVA